MAAIQDWLDDLGPEDDVVRRRHEESARHNGEASALLIEGWLSRPGGPLLVSEVLASCEAAATASVDGLRLLLLAAWEARSAAGAHRLLARLAQGPESGAAFGLETLAAAITPHALAERHPDEVLQGTVRWLLDSRVPLSSLAALEGTVRLAAASCRLQRQKDDFDARANRELAVGPLRESAVWQEAVESEGGSRADRCGGLLAALREGHVDELVRACGPECPGPDRGLAFALLSRLARERDARLRPERRQELAAALRPLALRMDGRDWSAIRLWAVVDRLAAEAELVIGFESSGRLDRVLFDALHELGPGEDERAAWVGALERLNRLAFTRGMVQAEALSAWVELNPVAGGRFLTAELSLESLPEGPLGVVVDALMRLGTPEAVERLREVSARPGASGARAGTALELIGTTAPEGIERLSAEWRRTRGSAALAQLYDTYIDRLRSGVPFGLWRARLGEPSSEIGGSLWFKSADHGCRLYVEIDREGRMTGWSLR